MVFLLTDFLARRNLLQTMRFEPRNGFKIKGWSRLFFDPIRTGHDALRPVSDARQNVIDIVVVVAVVM